jgi:hypothetical protein
MSGYEIKFRGKLSLMKELQRTVALWVWNIISAEEKRMGLVQQQELAFKLYHGEPGTDDMGYGEQLVKGVQMFRPLYKDMSANNSNEASEGELVMKKMYHCMEGVEIVSSTDYNKQGITMAVISSKFMKERKQMTGRSILDQAANVVTNARKALALINNSQYAKYLEYGYLPSGTNYKDYVDWLRQAMFDLLMVPSDAAKKTGVDSQGETLGALPHKDKMPSDWRFDGFIAFCLFGPIQPRKQSKDYKAEVFWTANDSSSSSKKKVFSFAPARKKEFNFSAARKKESLGKKRTRESDPVEEGRGPSHNHTRDSDSVEEGRGLRHNHSSDSDSVEEGRGPSHNHTRESVGVKEGRAPSHNHTRESVGVEEGRGPSHNHTRESDSVEEGRGLSHDQLIKVEQTNLMRAAIAAGVDYNIMIGKNATFASKYASIQKQIDTATNDERFYRNMLTVDDFNKPAGEEDSETMKQYRSCRARRVQLEDNLMAAIKAHEEQQDVPTEWGVLVRNSIFKKARHTSIGCGCESRR